MKAAVLFQLTPVMLALLLIGCGGTIQTGEDNENSTRPESRRESLLTKFKGSLEDAIDQRLVKIQGNGKNTYRELDVTIENISDIPLDIEVDAGTFFDNPKSRSQNLILLDDVSLSLRPGESETKTMSSACCNAGYSVPGDDSGWPVADAPKNLDLGLRFIGENDRIISEFLKKKNPEKLGTAAQQKQFKQVMIWSYLGDNYDDMRRMLAQDVFANDISKAEEFLSTVYEDAQELGELMRRRDVASLRAWVAEKSKENLDRLRESGNEAISKGRDRLRNILSN